MVAADQTVPLMLQLLEHAAGDVLRLTDIETYGSSSRDADDVERLGSLFDRYGSDKASDHNYHQLLRRQRSMIARTVRSVREIGIGTNNPRIVATMGRFGRPGAVIAGVPRLLPVGAASSGPMSIATILFAEDRIDTCHVDQTRPGVVRCAR